MLTLRKSDHYTLIYFVLVQTIFLHFLIVSGIIWEAFPAPWYDSEVLLFLQMFQVV